MAKLFSIFGAIYGMLGVILGAFGAHALEKMLTESNRLNTFETAVKYQFFHAILLLIVGFLYNKEESKLLKISGISTIIGVLIFSGSLYLICFSGISTFGAIAPIGGTLLVLAWGLLAAHFYRKG